MEGNEYEKGLLLDSTEIVVTLMLAFMFNPVLLYDLMLSAGLAGFAVFCLPDPDARQKLIQVKIGSAADKNR